MRLLVVLRGAPGAGKSKLIREKGLEPYTLSSDQLRLYLAGPSLSEEGDWTLTAEHDEDMWDLLKKFLEKRMKKGHLTVIDAIHTKTDDMMVYKDLATQYRYRVVCVDFSDIPKEVVLQRNAERIGYHRVPEKAIERSYARFQTERVPSFMQVVKPEELDSILQYHAQDFSQYEKIHHIGDIHGCAQALRQYFEKNGGIPTNELFIFTGDYTDRGIQNADVMEFLFSIQSRKNVIFLEGNHEKHLWDWANDMPIRSAEFRTFTQKELEEREISKKETRSFYRRLQQAVYYRYHDAEVVVTHTGLPCVPDNLMQIPTEQLVRGVGGYETEIDQIFSENSASTYQVHGHRNIQNYPVQANERSFNLEGHVEMGGHLRVAILSKNGWETVEIKNDVVAERHRRVTKEEMEASNEALLKTIRKNPLIIERPFGSISSFSFSPKVFYGKLWDAQTVKARGLFINTETTEIVARSYEKFYNIEEREEIQLDALQKNLVFPVIAYEKSNGYLGILGYDGQTGKMIHCSKSSIESDFARRFHKLFYQSIGYEEEKEREIKGYLRDENVSLIFEVIHPTEDPHIIGYQEPHLVLLDIVKRVPVFEKMPYEVVQSLATRHGWKYKEKTAVLNRWEEFQNFYEEQNQGWNPLLEGFVFEDASGFMTKLKLPFYNFWKQIRFLKERVEQGKEVEMEKLEPNHRYVYEWLQTQTQERLKEMSVVDIQGQIEIGKR